MHRQAIHQAMIANIFILLIAGLGFAYIALNLYAFLRADGRIFPAPASSYQDDTGILKLKSRDGSPISAIYLPAESKGRLLLYSCGNAEDIGTVRPFLELFQQHGISVLTYDYPGYGTSGGRASEQACYAAIEAAYNYAVNELDYTPNQITLYGHSLGSGPSTWLAARKEVNGLILNGAFTSTFRVMTEVKLLLWDKFDNYARLPRINAPTLLIHGTEDTIIPFSHALKNWNRIRGPKEKLYVAGAGHSNLIELAGTEYWNAVISFINSNHHHSS
ncbi:MAG: alpha/beta hydrolase [Puniceicoccaceae bacterium]|nr:MAG: alpha/beta hydrolase [Puniceicoccaceae bacterium]